MRCTAMSRLGVAFTSACQSPEIRLTLNVGSDGSPKVARPSNVDWLPDDRVKRGRSRVTSVAVPRPSHPVETIVRMSAPAPASATSRADIFRLLALGFDSRGSRVAQASNRDHGARLTSSRPLADLLNGVVMAVPEQSGRRLVRFGDFAVDLRAGELFKQGIKIRLQQQPFRILALLLEHPGEVVTREELRQAIWPAGTFVEFDIGLDAAIHKLRTALGDSAENPRLVETLPRRGYRLIVAEAPPEHPSAAGRRRVAVATIIGAIAFGSIAGLWHPWSRHTANSVAVLYFSARDTADAYLADGLTEDLTSLLGSVATVRVKSPGVVRRAQRASPGDTPAIARALGVRYLVDGNVRRVGTRVRVSIRLLTGATAVADWGDVFDRSPDELLALPSEIARAVAQHVGGPAPSSETRALGTLRTRSPAAYDHYLRGNFFLARRSPDQTARAVAEYREAERLDSGFAAAIGRAAYAHAIARGNYYRLPDAPIESLAVRGLGIAHRALRRDSTSSDAWMARGYLLAFANPRTMDGSVQAFQRAIALDPKNAEAHHQYGAILACLGRNAEADRELHLALALDPGRAISFSDLAAWSHVRDTALAVALMDSAV